MTDQEGPEGWGTQPVPAEVERKLRVLLAILIGMAGAVAVVMAALAHSDTMFWVPSIASLALGSFGAWMLAKR